MTDGTSALVERLKQLSSSVISDVLDVCGYPQQSLSSAIRPLDSGMRFAGAAVCCSGVSEPGAGLAAAVSNYEIDRCITPGAIVLIATHGHSLSAVVGGLMCLSFSLRSCAGIVTDGGVRDVSEIIALKLPTFCRYATPLNSARRWRLTAMQCAIKLPGQASAEVTIEPGDLVIGDVDGILAIPQAIAEDVIAWGERLVSIEERIVAELKAGGSRDQIFAAHPRFAHIGRLR